MRRLKLSVRAATEPAARRLVALGITANALTVAGLLLNCLAALLVALGHVGLGGLLYLLFSSLDFLDGAVARLSGQAGPFGAFFDSTVDRLSEAVLLTALVYWYAVRGEPLWSVVSAAALTGSFLVSYARARAEGLGYDCEVGLSQRPERIVLLGTALIVSSWLPIALPVALAILVVVTTVTIAQRIAHVSRLAGRDAGSLR